MGGGPKPPEVFKVLCTFKGENSATFSSGGLSVSIAGKEEVVDYYTQGKTYVFTSTEAPAD